MNVKKKKKKILEPRRNNAKLFPIYKMFSWDLLGYYSIQFLFFTITKGLMASELLIVSACCMIFKILMQIPAVYIVDNLGKRKALILGNSLLIAYVIGAIICNGLPELIFANLFWALGFSIKAIAETGLLYDSVSTKGGEGIYSKIDSKGGSYYYWLDGIICLCAGYLFVIDNYLPMFVCLGCLVVATILACRLKDIYKVDTSIPKEGIFHMVKDYGKDIKKSFKFVYNSNRLKSYIMFSAVFLGMITVLDTYKNNLLTYAKVPEEQFSIIIALLTMLAAITVTFSKAIHKKFKNKTLTFISLMYVGSAVATGAVAYMYGANLSIPFILVMYSIMRGASAIWNILKQKYLMNFTTEEIRSKVSFTFEIILGVVASIISIIGSIVLQYLEIQNAFLVMSLIFLIAIVFLLDYMRTRFGLRPSKYKKEDIEFTS